MNQKLELLSPSGDIDRLKLAVKFCADAVYVGGEMFCMRTNPSNFNADQLKEAVKANSFIPPYLLGYKSMPKSLPDFCTPGDEKEAIMYCWYSLSTWRSILGSLQWLRKNYR
mgnify:CR=1 FL=1